MDADDLVVDRNDEDRVGEVEMNNIQEQRRVVIPEGFLITLGMDVGDKVVVKCEEDGIVIRNAEDVV